MDDLARVESTEVAPSGIVAGLGSEEQDVVTYDNDAEEAPCPGEAPAVAAVMAAAYGDTRSIKPEDLVRAEGCDPEDRKLAIELIEKLRELMLGVFMHATEASYLIAYAHWYGELMSFELLKSRYSTIGGYADAFQLLAAVVTQIAEVLCGANVDIMQPRQSSMELCYSIRWPVPLSVKHSATNYCRGSRAVVLAHAADFAKAGWLQKDTWAFVPEKAEAVLDHLDGHMKILAMATNALKMAFDKLRKEKHFADLNKLYVYIFDGVPPLSTSNFPDYLWRIHQICSVLTNPTYSDKRQYSVEDKKLQTKRIQEDDALEALRIGKALFKLTKE